MNSGALFGLGVLMNFVASGIVTKLYIWPWLRVMTREEALLPLMVPHMFRFLGLSFLVPGVCFRFAVARFRPPGRLRRSRCCSACGRRSACPVGARVLGARDRMGLQSMGHNRFIVRDLPR